ncbi:cytochrome P450 3A9-like [Montipora foliosa]|uniref:cytochrome P450 3A9-like n=1 Tax=Montipora foliosa TaxID=591990 RepID=UPI0035F1D196
MEDSTKQTDQSTSTTYFSVLIGLGVAAVLYFTFKEVRNEAIRRRINSPGPKPWPFVGNLLEARKFNGYHLMLKHYYEKYGKVFCICLGRQPAVVVADPEILKKILVKDFSKFQNRFSQVQPTGAIGKSVFFARDQAWRRIRATLSPSFTAKKMKGMVSLIEESIDRLMEKVAKVAGTGESVDLLDWFSRVTLEVILSSAFGVQADVLNDERSLLLEKIKEVFRSPWIVDVLRRFPFGIRLIMFVRKVSGRMSFFDQIAADIVQQRRKSGPTQRQDLMDLMLIAHEESVQEGVSKLTDEEIVGQCVIFLLAGYETSSNTLGYIAYQLALNQEVQDKLRQMIKRAVDSNPDSTLYEIAQDIEYLDCVINEALRLHPPVAQVNRECAEDYEWNGIRIPAGLEVIVPVYSIHRDAEVWPDPEKFNPERFRSPAKDSRSPYHFMPFGLGPRSCIGMRFALMEVKITLVRFLMKYKIMRSPETQVPLKIVSGGTLYAKNGVHVRIEPL